MTNPKSEEVFYKLNDFSVKFVYVYSIEYFLCLLIWAILSIVWCCVLFFKMYSESKRFKYESRNRRNMGREKWDHLEKNYRLKRTTNMLMVLLCIIEIIVSVIVVSTLGGLTTYSIHSVSDRLNVHIITPFIDVLKDSFSIYLRLLTGFAASLAFSLFDILSMITVCFIKCYEFYPSKCKHPVRYGFIRLSIKIFVILLLSSVIQLLILKRVVVVILILYEYVKLIRLSRKLCRILYQRYFDARFHENKHQNIVIYYKQIHSQFKIGTTILLTSFFFHLFSLVIGCLYPILLTFLTDTKWFNLVYNIPVPMDYLVPWYDWTLMSVEQVVIMISSASLGLGSFIITVPYLFVTCLHIMRVIRKAIKYRNSSFRSELIKKMIEDHNCYYIMQ